MGVRRLGQKERGKGHIEPGDVRVEDITVGDPQADQGLGAAETFQLGHQIRQRRFGRTGGEHEDNLFSQKPEKTQDIKAREPGDAAKYDKDKKQRREVKRGYEFHERAQRRQAVFANREGHGAKSAYGGEPHEECNHAENGLRKGLQEIDNRLTARTGKRERKSKKQRNQQNLQDVSLAEGIDEGVRNNVSEKLSDTLGLCLPGVIGNGSVIQRGRVTIK